MIFFTVNLGNTTLLKNMLITHTDYCQPYMYIFPIRLINRNLLLDMYIPQKWNEEILCQEKMFINRILACKINLKRIINNANLAVSVTWNLATIPLLSQSSFVYAFMILTLACNYATIQGFLKGGANRSKIVNGKEEKNSTKNTHRQHKMEQRK